MFGLLVLHSKEVGSFLLQASQVRLMAKPYSGLGLLSSLVN